MKDFKCRCSAIGSIMTNPQRKSDPISKTALTYLETWLKEKVYGRKKEFANKYTDKGLIVEDNAIDLACEYLGLGFILKNEEHYSNDYLTGTPDLVLPDEVIDIKSSWDCFTFPLFDEDFPNDRNTPNKSYEYQLQGYMALTGKKKARLVYVLCDTPEHLIEREAAYTLDGRDSVEHFENTKARMTYPGIPIKHRVKSFEIQRDEDVINSIYERVELCREILSTYKITL